MTDRVKELATLLDITPNEVLKMLADDERIDRGEKLFELTEEQAKASKQARQVSRAPSTTPTKRERKADTDKRYLINLLCDALGDACVKITNPERQIDFEHNGKKYRIVLSMPRS
jgi:hypothetical protein